MVYKWCGRHHSNAGNPFHHFHIGHNQFQINDVHVPDRIGSALHMNDIFIVETPYYMDNRVSFPDIGTQTPTLARRAPITPSAQLTQT